MAFNAQTAGDEAIYVKFPGTSSAPVPKSGRSLGIPSGYQELRLIRQNNASGTILWAHKWRLNVSASGEGTVSPTSARIKDAKTGASVVVTATPNPDTITYETAVDEEGNVMYDDDGNIIKNEVVTEHSFVRWSDGSTTNPRTIQLSDHTNLIAIFDGSSSTTYTVTFVDWNGSVLKVCSDIPYGGSATPPSNPTREGYVFTGWNRGYSNVTSNFTVTALYNENNVTLTIYRYMADPNPVTVTVAKGSTVDVLDSQYNTTLTGWTFDGMDLSYSGTRPTVDGRNITLYSDTVAHLYWIREYNNLFVYTSKDEPKGNVPIPDPPDEETETEGEIVGFDKATFGIYSLSKASEVALPAGGHITIQRLDALLQHNGSATSHKLAIAPMYISTGITDSEFGAVTYPSSGSVSTIIDDRSGTKKSISKTLQFAHPENWGKWRPRTKYSESGYPGDNWDWFYDEGEDSDPNNNLDDDSFPSSTWSSGIAVSTTVASHSSGSRIYGSSSLVQNNCRLSVAIDFQKVTGDNSKIATLTYESSSHDITEYDIPSSINGAAVNRLGFALIKLSSGCTVQWRFFIYRFIVCLY